MCFRCLISCAFVGTKNIFPIVFSFLAFNLDKWIFNVMLLAFYAALYQTTNIICRFQNRRQPERNYLCRVNNSSSHQIFIISSCSIVTTFEVITGKHLEQLTRLEFSLHNTIRTNRSSQKTWDLKVTSHIPSPQQHSHWLQHSLQVISMDN